MQHNSDNELAGRIKNLIKQYKDSLCGCFTINTFGFGENNDDFFLSRFAQYGNGSYYYIGSRGIPSSKTSRSLTLPKKLTYSSGDLNTLDESVIMDENDESSGEIDDCSESDSESSTDSNPNKKRFSFNPKQRSSNPIPKILNSNTFSSPLTVNNQNLEKSPLSGSTYAQQQRAFYKSFCECLHQKLTVIAHSVVVNLKVISH
jgi:hypothetical protein